MHQIVRPHFHLVLAGLLALLGAGPRLDAATSTTWSGTVSTDWNVAGNWTGSGSKPPAIGDDVTIPADVVSARYPVLGSGAANAKTLTLKAGGTPGRLQVGGGTLTIAANVALESGTLLEQRGGIVSAAGTISTSGILDQSAGILLGQGSLTVNSGGQLKVSDTGLVHLAASTGATPTDGLVVNGTLVQSGGTIAVKDLSGAGTTSVTGGLLRCHHDFKMTGFNATGGTVEFAGGSGGAAFPAGTYQFFNVIIDPGANPGIDKNASVVLKVGGHWQNDGAPTLTAHSTVVEFNGAGDQEITGSSVTAFANVLISNTGGTVSALQNFSVAASRTATVASGARLDLGTQMVSGAGTFTLASGATLGIGSPAGLTAPGTTAGNVQTTGARNFNTGANYIYAGTSAQVTGSGLPSAVNTLTINNTSGITLSAGVAVAATLALGVDGRIRIPTASQNVAANALTIGGVGQPPGSWGSSASAASFKDDLRFDTAGTGLVNAVAGSGGYRLTGIGQPRVGVGYTVTVSLADAAGATVTGFNGTRTLTVAANPALSAGTDGSVATIRGVAQGVAGPLTFSAGVATVVLVAHRAESDRLVTASDGVLGTGTPGGLPLRVSPTAGEESAYRLVGSGQPQVGVPFGMGVQLVDVYQNVLPFTGPRDLTFDASPRLSPGTDTSIATVNGVAQGATAPVGFVDGAASVPLVAHRAEANRTLTVTDGVHASAGVGGATLTLSPTEGVHTAFRILAATPTPNAGDGDAMVLEAVDLYQNRIAQFTGMRAFTFTGPTAARDGTRPTVTDASGIAQEVGSATTISFDQGLSVAGGVLRAYRAESLLLSATDATSGRSTGGAGGIGASITVSPASANRLAFTVQPGGGTGGVALSPQPSVQVQDLHGNTVTGGARQVALALGIVPAPGATLAGTTAVDVDPGTGTATFQGLSVDKAGRGYALLATCNDLAAATSASFDVDVGPAARLAFAVQPASVAAGGAFVQPVTIQVQDAGGNTVTTDNVTTVRIGSPTTAFVGSVLQRTVQGGVAVFDPVRPTTVGSSNILTAEISGMVASQAPSLPPVTSGPFAVTLASCSAADLSATWTTVGNTTIRITLADGYGLSSLRGLRFVNLASVTYQAYSAGDALLAAGDLTDWTTNALLWVELPKSPVGTVRVEVTGVRANPTQRASLNAQAFDRCEQFSKTIDPVSTTLEVGVDGATRQEFLGIPSAEHHLSLKNGIPGLRAVVVWVNGTAFFLPGLADGRARTLDFGSAMQPGEGNTVVLVGEGMRGSWADVAIGDGSVEDPDSLGGVGVEPFLQWEQTLDGLRVSWPEAFAGWILQMSPRLGDPGAWTDWPKAPRWVEHRYQVTMPLDSPHRWLRLLQPSPGLGPTHRVVPDPVSH